MAETPDRAREQGMEIARTALERLEAQPGDVLAGRALDAALDMATEGGPRCVLRLLALARLARECGEEPPWARRVRVLLAPEGVERQAPVQAPAPATVSRPPVAATRATTTARRPPVVTHRLLVDACNFLGSAPDYMLDEEASRTRLTARLQQYARRHPALRVVAVFDGAHPRSEFGNLEIRGTTSGHSADDVLIAALDRLDSAERPAATLVTDDRSLAARARALGVPVRPVSWLHERLHRSEPEWAPPEKPAPGRVEGWEEFFSRPPQRPTGKKRGR